MADFDYDGQPIDASKEKHYQKVPNSIKVTGAKRDSLTLPSLRTIPPEALGSAATAFEYGGLHYGWRNWEKGLPIQQLIDSTRRHLNNIEARHEIDDTEGGSFLPEHCVFMASAMMLVTSLIRGISEDDRLPSPKEFACPDVLMQPKEIARWMQEMLTQASEARSLRAERVVGGESGAAVE